MNEINVFVFNVKHLGFVFATIQNFAKGPHCPHQDALAWLVFLVLVHCCCWITFTFPSWILFGKLGCEILAITMLFGKIGCEIFLCGNLACEIGKIDLVMFAIEILLGSSIAGHFYLQPKLDCWTFLFATKARLLDISLCICSQTRLWIIWKWCLAKLGWLDHFFCHSHLCCWDCIRPAWLSQPYLQKYTELWDVKY